ncbi:cytochrome P450, putative [Talaromyces stipitatus ATCC 10500]|uniref:Cytochrome P450, putative n=1 Tax=Talaromyces stipitatus (strain ATCC 10500 / CBS 375.48 / QM 6759 / NRRL 1006) TaxID=441959 RepID=B8MLS3_TALSN|nr:cytochrome P450, putative [Talaromyces stipitatus ATCC 10500]EED13645.1 cytochrome P450, putative [Talaromyces stipitatus ATCC 10500]
MFYTFVEALPYNPDRKQFLFVTLVAAVLVFLFFVQLRGSKVKSQYPLVGFNLKNKLFTSVRQRWFWFKHGPELIHDSFKKFPDAIFTLPSLDRTSIVLPPRFLQEIRDLPGTIGNNSHATSDFFIGDWTTLDYEIFNHSTIDAIKTQYIAKIGQQIGPASDEASYAFNKHFGRYEDWTPIVAQPRILQLVSQMVARTIVGPDICRDPEWVPAVITYAQNVFMAAVAFKLVPDMARPFAGLFTPYLYRIHRARRTIRRLVRPAIEQTMAWRRENPESWTAHTKDDTVTTLEWLVETSEPKDATVPMIAHRLTGVSFGAAHTTSNTITNAILDLANDFDHWAPPLRQEIGSVLGENSITSLSNSDLSKMWKLDSFLKESQRFHPPSKLSVNRKMMKDHTLFSGDVLPKDAHVSFAGVPMSMSEEFLKNAEEFDGFRFERLRRNPETDHNGLQFTSSYAGSLHFGHGRYMCPGRFMGSLISKLMVIELLRRYDLKLQEGGRPKNIMFFDMDIPDPKYEILFRDRKA